MDLKSQCSSDDSDKYSFIKAIVKRNTTRFRSNNPQAEALKSVKKSDKCRRLRCFGDEEGEIVLCSTLKRGDRILVKEGEQIPTDGEIMEGSAEIDESNITGEDISITKTADMEECSVTGGTIVVSGRIIMKATVDYGESLLDNMINTVECSCRRKINHRIILEGLLMVAVIAFLVMSVIFYFIGGLSIKVSAEDSFILLITLIILVFSLCPIIEYILTRITENISMKNLNSNKIYSKGIRAVEAIGKANVVLINKALVADPKKKQVAEIIPLGDLYEEELAELLLLASLDDKTIEGKLIVKKINEKYNIKANKDEIKKFVSFTQQRPISGVVLKNNKVIKKGAPWAIKEYLEKNGGNYDEKTSNMVKSICRKGETPIVIANEEKVLGIVAIKDTINDNAKDMIKRIKRMKVKTVLSCGGTPTSTLAFAKKLGIDSFLAQATLDKKIQLIDRYQKDGYIVIVTGCGNNDAPILAKADVGISKETATNAAKEACNVISLHSNIELANIIEKSKWTVKAKENVQVICAIAEAVKYFVILPALFIEIFSKLTNIKLLSINIVENVSFILLLYNVLVLTMTIPLTLKYMNNRKMKNSQYKVR